MPPGSYFFILTMIYFLGITFIDGTIPELLSVALVTEDGREYSASLVPGEPDCKNRRTVRKEIERFTIGRDKANPIEVVEIWANLSARDFVAFIQLWGSLRDLPNQFQLYELPEYLSRWNDTVPKHLPFSDALTGARWVRDMYKEYVQGARLSRDYQIGDVVDIDHNMTSSVLGAKSYRGIGVVSGWEGEERVIVDVIDERGFRSIFRVSLHYTSLRLLYRYERK